MPEIPPGVCSRATANTRELWRFAKPASYPEHTQQMRKRSASREDSPPSSPASSAEEDEDIPLVAAAAAGNGNGEVLTLEFCFSDTRDDDDFSALLQHGTMGRCVQSTRTLNRLLVEQRSVGTTVKQEGDESEVFAFATVISPRHLIHAAPIKELRGFVLKRCPEASRSKLGELFDNDSLGVVIHERIVNVPDVLIAPLFSCLLEDLAWAKDNPQEDEGDFDFENFLLIAPCFAATGSEDGTSKKPKKKKLKQAAAAAATALVEYLNSEDYVFATKATLSIPIDLPRVQTPGVDAPPGDDARPAAARILVLSKLAFAQAIAELQQAMS